MPGKKNNTLTEISLTEETERLYASAFAFRETKLWNRVSGDRRQLFAVDCGSLGTAFGCIERAERGGVLPAVIAFTMEELYSHFLLADHRVRGMPEDLSGGTALPPWMLNEMAWLSFTRCDYPPKRMIDPENMRAVQSFAQQRGFRVSGTAGYPRFSRILPGRAPWRELSRDDMERLSCVLEAAAAIAKEYPTSYVRFQGIHYLAITGKEVKVPYYRQVKGAYVHSGELELSLRAADPDCPKAGFKRLDFLLGDYCAARCLYGGTGSQELADILKQKERIPGRTAACGIVHAPEPMQENPAAAPVYPAFFFVVDVEEEKLQLLHPIIDFAGAFPELPDVFLHAFLSRASMPETIIAQDLRTYNLLFRTAEAAGCRIVLAEETNHHPDSLEDAEISFFYYSLEKEEVMEEAMPPGSLCYPDWQALWKGPLPPLSFVIRVKEVYGSYSFTVRVSADDLLADLHEIIQKECEFENDHPHAFDLEISGGTKGKEYLSDSFDGQYRTTNRYTLREAGLRKGKEFLYIFDFGDNWRFSCKVMQEISENTMQYEILSRTGERPEQYPEDAWF